jgi:ADP-ribose pyrophosphatase YjhB (NUDIX family)
MFLKCSTRKKDGKEHRSWSIVETPEESARKELCEETGCEVDQLELLARFSPSTARFTNRMWVFFGSGVRVAARPTHARETGLETVWHRSPIRELLHDPQFFAAGMAAALLAAAAAGRIKL